MSKQTEFIEAIAPLARAEFLNRDRWVLPSVCIAQAALESGWNVKAKTLFGIKGSGAKLKTTEYISGKYVSTTASFKAYPNLASAVHGYYDLITGNARYSGAVNNLNYESAVKAIKAGGYATDPGYVGKVLSIIRSWNLTKYDDRTVKSDHKPATDGVANRVIRGEFGNGDARRESLIANGYDPDEVQAEVNRILGAKTAPKPAVNLDDIARKVIRGEYGNGAARTAKLKAEGYDPAAVQKRVNQLLKG